MDPDILHPAWFPEPRTAWVMNIPRYWGKGLAPATYDVVERPHPRPFSALLHFEQSIVVAPESIHHEVALSNIWDRLISNLDRVVANHGCVPVAPVDKSMEPLDKWMTMRAIVRVKARVVDPGVHILASGVKK